MEKKLFLAFFITFGFLIVWSRLMQQYVPQPPPLQIDRKKIMENPSPSGTSLTMEGELLGKLETEPQNLDQTVSVRDFSITYSTTGGYIKRIYLGKEKDQLPFENIGLSLQDADKKFTFAQPSEEKIVFVGPSGEKKEFTFDNNSLLIKWVSPPPTSVLLFSNFLQINRLDQASQEIFFSRDDGGVIERKHPKKMTSFASKNIRFIGVRDRYYCLSLLKGSYNIEAKLNKDKTYIYLNCPPSEIAFYLGPQREKDLKPYGLENVINHGFFHPIGVFMTKSLYFFYSLSKNWGLSIIFLATIVYLCSFPFTAKSTQAMKKMQQLQPEIEILKQKYKENPQKLQKETMELYKKYKVNPLGGCLPLLLQMPIFLTLYQVLPRFIELKGAKFLWIKDLASPDHLSRLPFPPPLDYLNLLPVLLMILGLAQQKITATSGTSEQKKMGLFFGVFIGVIFYNFPSCLVLYWFVQNLLTFVYQVRTTRVQPRP